MLACGVLKALIDQVMDSAEDIRRKYIILTYGQALVSRPGGVY